MPAGWLWRIVCTEGPQVADMNCWNLNNTDERFYTSKTRQIHATHLTTGDRLWSQMPYLRPLATITEDTIAYGFDEDGASCHDVIGSRCDPYTNHLLSGEDMNTCCHSNLTRQALRDGLSEADVHDVLNVFMCTGFTKDTHQYFTKPSPVVVGDYIEFLAETDVLVSASACPQVTTFHTLPHPSARCHTLPHPFSAVQRLPAPSDPFSTTLSLPAGRCERRMRRRAGADDVPAGRGDLPAARRLARELRLGAVRAEQVPGQAWALKRRCLGTRSLAARPEVSRSDCNTDSRLPSLLSDHMAAARSPPV